MVRVRYPRPEDIVFKPTQLIIKRIYGVQWKKPRTNQDELAKLYWDQGLSQIEIARRYKIRRATIAAAVKAYKPNCPKLDLHKNVSYLWFKEYLVNWKVDYEPHVKAEIKAQLASGVLTKEDLQTLYKWVDQIEVFGLDRVQTDYWNDHPLEAEWTGLRSASFSLRGRIIYRIENKKLIVMVVRITATHNYRR